MSEVYIVNWFSAESYSDYSGVDSVWETLELAEEYLASKGKGPHKEYPYSDPSEEYFLSEAICCFLVGDSL